MSALDSIQCCFYCGSPVDPVNDCWITHGTMAHPWCAWGADEGFWVMLDAEEREDN